LSRRISAVCGVLTVLGSSDQEAIAIPPDELGGARTFDAFERQQIVLDRLLGTSLGHRAFSLSRHSTSIGAVGRFRYSGYVVFSG
jgi:hypothetical protein